jgi:hypothetical protein
MSGNIFSDPVKLAWVAGLLEGEGAFMVTSKESKVRPYPVFRISCNMCDGDVLEKLYKWVGFGRFSGPCVPKNVKHRPFWRFDVHRRDDVYKLCKAILPLMGARRSDRIRRVIAAYESSGRIPWRHGTRAGYDDHACRCELCTASNAQRGRVSRARRKARKNNLTDIAGYAGLAEKL